jgi:chromosomal replication initiation ATPase DnaA
VTITFIPLNTETRTPREIREALCAKIAAKHGLTTAELYGHSKLKKLAHARFEVWACLHAHGMSTPRIGRIFGRDHSTIISGLKRYRALAKQEAA